MSLEWKTTTIGELCSKVSSGGTPKSTNEKYYGGDIPWLNTKEINFNRIYDTEKHITQDGFENSAAKWVKKESVIVAMYGATAAKVAMNMVDLTTNQACCNLTIENRLANPKFIYYYLYSNYGRLLNLASGAAQQNLNSNLIKEFPISIPPLNVQNKIVNVLSTIDDKIEMNEKINKNLEQLLHTIFNHWFISFDKFKNVSFKESPLGDIPDGWNYGALRELLTLTKNPIKANKTNGLPYLPIDIIPMNSLGISELKSDKEANSSLITFNKNDILIGAMRVYFHRVVISPCSGVTRSTCFVLNPKQEHHLSYLLLLCNLDRTIQYAQNTSKGTTMPYAVWDNGLGDMDIIIPPEDILLDFHELVFPIIEKIRDSYLEINKLSKLRDTLLPKLMSGEIDVSKINCDLKFNICFKKILSKITKLLNFMKNAK
ncbi:restriction endonuclease subunit S [uncultured Methanobrevibacter sp.]|uniref:restriction endonuclease subunit S n=1 Tax=uncultured Methanobrevibacter sp. TaxID=253161 RepID=UPI0025D4CD13|nr:restriction endonuclease subunit S [uncultured Methanobrevibacter sp.]